MHQLAIEDLARSGIVAASAEHAGMEYVENASLIYRDFKPVPALIIPYFDPWNDDLFTFERRGEAYDFCRVRYLKQVQVYDKKKNRYKVQRYAQPIHSGTYPYFPEVPTVDWQRILNDTNTPIMITEGEKKALGLVPVLCLEESRKHIPIFSPF